MSTRQVRMPGRSPAGGKAKGSGDRNRPVEACTFDCYGTLIDWRTGIERSLGRLLREEGYAGTGPVFPAYDEAERTVEHRYAPYREVLASAAMRAAGILGTRLAPARAREFADSLPTWSAFADTAEVLRALGRRGVRRIILSNVDRGLLEGTLRRSRLEVDGFVTAEDVRSYKPAPSHWREFLRRYLVPRTATLHVAQSWFHDIVPAGKLGFRTVWVDRYDESLPAHVRPTFIARDLRDLLRFIES